MSLVVISGLVLAAVAWGALFGLPRGAFWSRAALAGLAIGVYGVVAQRSVIGELLTPTAVDVALGVAGAVVLYGVFWTGSRLLRRWFPAAAAHVDTLYDVRSIRTSERLPIAAVLLLVGPCEELFWRGFVQSRVGFVVALAGYAAVHVWERKPVLVLAAVVGGAFWAGLFAWRETLVAPIVSHALWDLAVVVWFPLTTGAPLGLIPKYCSCQGSAGSGRQVEHAIRRQRPTAAHVAGRRRRRGAHRRRGPRPHHPEQQRGPRPGTSTDDLKFDVIDVDLDINVNDVDHRQAHDHDHVASRPPGRRPPPARRPRQHR